MSEADIADLEDRENPAELLGLIKEIDKEFLSFLDNNHFLKKIPIQQKKKITENLATKNNDKEFQKQLQQSYEYFGFTDDILIKKHEDATYNNIQEQLDESRHSQDEVIGEKPDENEIFEEFQQKLLDDNGQKIKTDLEKKLIRDLAQQQAKTFCLEYELVLRNKNISDMAIQKQNSSKQIEELLKDKQISEGNRIKQEQRIQRLEKSLKENEELYNTIKHLLNLNIAEIEQSAISKAKKIVNLNPISEEEQRPYSSNLQKQKTKALFGDIKRPTTAIQKNTEEKQNEPKQIQRKKSILNTIQPIQQRRASRELQKEQSLPSIIKK